MVPLSAGAVGAAFSPSCRRALEARFGFGVRWLVVFGGLFSHASTLSRNGEVHFARAATLTNIEFAAHIALIDLRWTYLRGMAAHRVAAPSQRRHGASISVPAARRPGAGLGSVAKKNYQLVNRAHDLIPFRGSARMEPVGAMDE
jgi:hypothetical protein